MHGNYLKGSVQNAGLDPDNLPESDKSKMDFGSDSAKAKLRFLPDPATVGDPASYAAASRASALSTKDLP